MTDVKAPEVHPVQANPSNRQRATAPVAVTLRAYEVYKHIFGAQQALITGHCRGGFSAGELVAFLYARSFPKDEWRARFDEALNGLNID